MTKVFNIISDVIRTRRSTKPAKMNGNKIPDELLRAVLELGNWAPTHGNTEPWRYMVFANEKVTWFCEQHAQLYKEQTSPDKFEQAKYDKQLHNGDLASHIVVAVMQRGKLPKVTVLEEIAAVAASIQNILLGAAAAGLAAFWSTGGLTHHKAMKEFLRLHEHDNVMGILYFGYSDEQMPGKRQTGIAEKSTWSS